MLADPFLLNATFRLLLNYGLIRRNPQPGTFNVHRLVQVVLMKRLPEEDQRSWIELLIRIVDQLLFIKQDRLDVESWPWIEQLLPHIQRILQHSNRWELASPELGTLLLKVATYQLQRANYEQAALLYRRALVVQEQVFGPAHADLIPTLSGLARANHNQGNDQEVEACYRRAIDIGETYLGCEHLQLAQPLQGLAYFYICMGENQYDRAEELYQRALCIRVKHQKLLHPDIAIVLSDLALLYHRWGYYTKARLLHLQAIWIREQVLDPCHPEVAASLHDIAIFYSYQARYAEAEQFFLRSLSLQEHALGPDHIYVMMGLNDLADLYCEQAKYELAEPLYLRGLSMSQQIQGLDDAFVALLLNKLALLYTYQARYEEAEALAARALLSYEPEHYLHVIGPLYTLALLAYKQGRYAQAEEFSFCSLAMREKIVQPDHPVLAKILHLHANVCLAHAKYEEAEIYYQRALHILQKALGPEHIDIAILLSDFATLYLSQGQWAKAGQCYLEALQLWKRFHDLDHLAYADCLEHYAKLLAWQYGESIIDTYILHAWEIRIRCWVKYQRTSQELPSPGDHLDERDPLPSVELEEEDFFTKFLQECCILSNQVVCPTADLWRAYQEWMKAHTDEVPLSRQAFAFQLKVRGCSPERTNSYRVWRRIALRYQS